MKDKFYFQESTNSFFGEIDVLGKQIEFEIRLNESELNWAEIEKFADHLKGDTFTEIINTSNKLLMEFIKLVPLGVKEPFGAYDFRIDAIVYYGKVDNRIFGQLVDGFDLIFKLYHSDYVECDDPYGNYIIRVDNRLITGVRREQV